MTTQDQRLNLRSPIDLCLISLEYEIDRLRRLMHQADHAGLTGVAVDAERLWMGAIKISGGLGRCGGQYPSGGVLGLLAEPRAT